MKEEALVFRAKMIVTFNFAVVDKTIFNRKFTLDHNLYAVNADSSARSF